MGWHAGGRGRGRTFGAHVNNKATAAWRCALKYWFPSRPNSVVLYDEAKAVTITQLGPDEFRADLTVSEEDVGRLQFSRPVQALLDSIMPTPSAKPTDKVAAPVPVAAGGHKTKTAKAKRADKRPAGKAKR